MHDVCMMYVCLPAASYQQTIITKLGCLLICVQVRLVRLLYRMPLQQLYLYTSLLHVAEEERMQLLESLDTMNIIGLLHVVDRESIFSSVVELYSVNTTVNEFPLRVHFKGEKAIHVGGVFRDMLSAFWDEAYCTLFDGGCLLTPVLHLQMDLAVFPILGQILSHGYLSNGFLPIRIAFPTLVSLLLGPAVEVGDDLLTEASHVSKALCVSSVTFGSDQRG